MFRSPGRLLPEPRIVVEAARRASIRVGPLGLVRVGPLQQHGAHGRHAHGARAPPPASSARSTPAARNTSTARPQHACSTSTALSGATVGAALLTLAVSRRHRDPTTHSNFETRKQSIMADIGRSPRPALLVRLQATRQQRRAATAPLTADADAAPKSIVCYYNNEKRVVTRYMTSLYTQIR